MGRYSEEDQEYGDEMGEEDPEGRPESDPETELVSEREIPDVEWAEYIARIENPDIREEEIEAAERFLEKEAALERLHDAGEIPDTKYRSEMELLRAREATAAARCASEAEKPDDD